MYSCTRSVRLVYLGCAGQGLVGSDTLGSGIGTSEQTVLFAVCVGANGIFNGIIVDQITPRPRMQPTSVFAIFMSL